jgi:hypothetical protein
MSRRSSGAQSQLEYAGSLHESRRDGHQSVNVISPRPSLSEDNSEQTVRDRSGFSSVLELSLSQISAKSDV